MPLPRLSTLLGGLLLSRRGRSLAARHAGKIALATLAWRLWKSRRAPVQSAGTGGAGARAPHRRQRWSGRRR